MTDRRLLGETLGAFADVTELLAHGLRHGLQVRSIEMELPLDLRLNQGAEGPEIVGDLPQFLTRTAFDTEPARMVLTLRAAPADEPQP
jgi:hypothetical protein